MPKFFFGFQRGNQIAEDDEGEDFPGLDQAHAAALASARELVADNIKFAGSSPWEMSRCRKNSSDNALLIS